MYTVGYNVVQVKFALLSTLPANRGVFLLRCAR